MRTIAVAIICLFMAGCAGAGRWSDASTETLVIEGEPYKVAWKRTADGVDAYSSLNTAFTLLPDKLEQKRRSTDAMRQIASRECGSEVELFNETNIELTFEAQFRCIQRPVGPAPTKRRSQRS